VELSEKKDSAEEEDDKRPFLPSGARLYYIRGGILLSMQRYQEAIPYLQKALRHCAKWDGLEGSIRHMLVACYDKYMPLPPPDVTNEATDSSMLDTFFHLH
jgi:tetratricopeptide (TPR) repeat protein